MNYFIKTPCLQAFAYMWGLPSNLVQSLVRALKSLRKGSLRPLLSCVLVVFFLAGCAQHRPEPLVVVTKPSESRWNEPKNWSPHDPSLQSVFQQIARTAIGTPYVRGGSSTAGFDCSGFVQWAYRHMGVKLPRTAREQADYGALVPQGELQIGDIVAFRHPRRGYHTGIYMGEDRFVHSPSKRQQVRYSSLKEPYFRDSYIGARRVAVSKNVDIAAASRRMAELETGRRSDRDVLAALPASTTVTVATAPAHVSDKRTSASATSRQARPVSKVDKSGKAGKTDKAATAGKNVGKSIGKTDKAGKSDKVGPSTSRGQSDKLGQARQVDKPGKSGRSGRSGQTGPSGQTGLSGRSGAHATKLSSASTRQARSTQMTLPARSSSQSAARVTTTETGKRPVGTPVSAVRGGKGKAVSTNTPAQRPSGTAGRKQTK